MKMFNKDKNNFMKYFLCIVFNVVCLLYPYISFSFTSDAYFEAISTNISHIAINNSTTKTFNLDILSTATDTSSSSLSSLASSCRSMNLNKTSFDTYNFRVAFNSALGTYVTFDDVNDDTAFSVLPVTSTTIHLNELGEPVFDWFEVKTVYGVHAPFNWNKSDTIILLRERTIIQIFDSLGLIYDYDTCKSVLDAGFYLTADFYNPYGLKEGTDKYHKYQYQVVNIIKDNEGHDLYLTKVFGDYFISYVRNLYNCNGYTVNFDFGSSIMETKTYLDYIFGEFPVDTHSIIVNKNNLINIDGNVEKMIKEIELFSQRNLPNLLSNNFCSITSIFLAMGLNFALFLYSNKYNKKRTIFLSLSIFTLLYLLMSLLNKIFGDFVSRMFTTNAIFFSLLVLFIFLFFNLLLPKSNKDKVEEIKEDNNYFTVEI